MTSRLDTVDVGGFRIAYRRAGAGPPIVCLHGYVGDGRTWNLQLDSLSDMFSVVAWDAPGFGQSIPDVGHIVNLEASDSFNAQARGFLLRAGRGSGRPG